MKKVEGGSNPQPSISVFKKEEAASLEVSEAINQGTLTKPEIETISPITYPNFFYSLRGAVCSTEGLRKFIDWQKNKHELLVDNSVKNVFNADSSINGTIEDLISPSSKHPIDLSLSLQNILIKSNDFEEKIILVKTLFSLGRGDEFIVDFLVPVLENKKDFENIENNQKFCIRFLNSIGKDELEKTFGLIDYNSVKNINNFAQSLIKTADPIFVLDNLMRKADLLATTVNKFDLNDGENKQAVELEKIHLIVLAILDSLSETTFTLPIKHLKTLYEKSDNFQNIYKVADILSKHFETEAAQIFRDKFLDNFKTDDLSRKKRYCAIGHYLKVVGENAFPTLKEFILSEEDPLLINYASYLLVNNCGVDGKRALGDVVIKQIKEGKTSCALAAITQMSKFNTSCIEIFKRIFLKSFTEGKDLKQAYLNLTEVTKIATNDKGGAVFHVNPEEKNDLIIDLVKNIGLKTLGDLAAGLLGKTPEIRQSFKKNALDIFECACIVNKEAMKKLFLEALAADSEELSLFKKLVGISHFLEDVG